VAAARIRRVLALLLVLQAAPAAAAEPVPLRYALAADVTVTAVAVAAWAGTELAKPSLAPARCRWCEPGALDAAAREGVVWQAPARARRASDVLAFGLVPAGVAAHQLLAANHAGDAEAGWVDLLLVAEATAIAADLTQLVKYSVGRRRPGALHAAGRERDPDDDLSFWSGHTSLAFSLVASAGTVSTMRGYPSAPWIWGGGVAMAAGVGYLRMAGDAHWLSDVLAGAAAGIAVGVAVPKLLHGPEAGAAGTAQGLAGPRVLAFAFPF
jgi:membrane-associated phospholipid phosphatase